MDATKLAASLLDPIPANVTLGITVTSAVDGVGEVAMTVSQPVTNVIGSLHSSGLAALVDAAALAAVISAADRAEAFDGVIPLGAEARFEFLAPARGDVRARCRLTREARAALEPVLRGEERKATLHTDVDVLDEEDAVVCRGAFTWRLRRMD